MSILIFWLISTLVILTASYIIPGVSISGFGTALLVSLTIGIVNVFIRPFLIFLTLPINILTLGLFTFVINAFLFWLVAQIVPGFKISNFGTAILFAIVVAIINGLILIIFPV